MGDNKIIFEKEVAETLGIEAAIILELYKTKEFDDSLSEKDIFKQIAAECPFINTKTLTSNFEKLKKVKLIKLKSNQYKQSTESNFDLKTPNKNYNDSKIKISPTWIPSKETIEDLELGGISINFAKSKLKEFKIYWTERSQARDNYNILFLDYIRR